MRDPYREIDIFLTKIYIMGCPRIRKVNKSFIINAPTENITLNSWGYQINGLKSKYAIKCRPKKK